MKKFSLSLIVWTISYFSLQAQEILFTSNYRFNPIVLNPALTGTEDTWRGVGSRASTFTRVPGAPVFGSLSFDGKMLPNVGGGVVAFVDVVGMYRLSALQFAGSYQVPLKSATLYLGLSSRIISLSEDTNFFHPTSSWTRLALSGDIGVGAYLTSAKYTFGLSSPRLIRFGDLDFYNPSMVYSVMGSYRIDRKGFTLEPTVFYIYQPEINQGMGDFLLKGYFFNDVLMLGSGYRTRLNCGSVLAGVTIKQRLKLSYSLEFPLQSNKYPWDNYFYGGQQLTLAITSKK